MRIWSVLTLQILLLCQLPCAAGYGDGDINAYDIQMIKQVHEKYGRLGY